MVGQSKNVPPRYENVTVYSSMRLGPTHLGAYVYDGKVNSQGYDSHMSKARRVQLLPDTSTQLINCHVNCKERGAGERNDRTSGARRAVRASDMAQRTREAVSLSARITALIGAPCWAGHLGCLKREHFNEKSKRECMQNTFTICSFEKGQTTGRRARRWAICPAPRRKVLCAHRRAARRAPSGCRPTSRWVRPSPSRPRFCWSRCTIHTRPRP